LKKKYYIPLVLFLGNCISTGVLNTSHAQQSINLIGVEYHHNITPNNNAPDFYNFKAQATVPILYSDNYFFAALPRYNQTHIEDPGFGLSSHIFRRVNVPFIFEHKISSHQSIGGILSPGIHSDFKDISREDWVFIAAVFLKNTKNPHFHFRYGLVFSRQITGMMIIPAVMFNWQPTDRITVDNNDPLSPEFSYNISRNLAAGIVLQRRGGTSKLSETFQSRSIKDVRYEMAPYIDFNIWDKFVLRGAAGYTLSRQVKLFEDIDAGSTWSNIFKDRGVLMERKFSGWFFNVGLRLEINRNQ